MKTTATLAPLALLLVFAGAADSVAAPKTPKPDPATKSEAVTQEVLDALGSEIERSMRNLRIEGAINPYFISYKVTEVEVNDVTASMGAATSTQDRHFAILEAHVHVGSYKFDNSNFVFRGSESVDGIAQLPLPLEANPELARRTAWLVTDAAYKEALEQIRAKQDALRTGVSGGMSDIPSYTKEKPVVSKEPVLVPRLEDESILRKRAEKISRVFRDQKHIRDSRVSFTSFLERRWYLNSEGTRSHDTRRVSGVAIVATAQASDGQELARYFTHYGLTDADLPSDAALERRSRELAKSLDALRSAPLVEPYTGPVLFTGGGAAGMVRHTLARHLAGTPLPVGLSDRDSARFGGELVNRLGLRVISPLLSVVDDPTKHTWRKSRLIGGFRLDDEGVAAQRVQVIERGKLKSLLMSRTPSEHIKGSNGHARLSLPGGLFRGSTTNLFIEGRRGLSKKALERKLLAEAKAQGLDYALVIEQFDDAALTANPELSRVRIFQLLSSLDPEAPPMALLAYRLYPGGKKELVRGVQLKPVDMRAWRDVMAVGQKRTTKNYLNATEDPFTMRIRQGDQGFVPSSGIESAVVTPDLLFRELDVKQSTAWRRAEPAVPRP